MSYFHDTNYVFHRSCTDAVNKSLVGEKLARKLNNIVVKIHPFPLSNAGSVVEHRTGNQRSPVRIPSTASRRKYSFSSILLSVYLC